MEIIVIAGNAHSVGKTTLVRQIVENLRYGVGVIKSSIHSGTLRVVSADPEWVEVEGTDTALVRAAGAEKVVFLQTDEENLPEDLRKAMELIGETDYLVIEGNRVLDYVNPDLIIYISREGVESKPSARKAESRAQVKIDSDAFFAGREQGLIPFTWTQSRMTCQQAHLLGKVMGWNLVQVGKLIDEKGIKVKVCQLGLFK